MLLGAIADDLTGATDLALMLSRQGMQTVLAVGVPSASFDYQGADAVVVALKSRTIPAAEAVRLSLGALACLTGAGARQVVFKYCSTFDSTPEGNIGPVAEALLEALETDITIVCPAFPANGRTVYQGHLFVGEQLLSESPMKDHPLTPMTDSSLVRLLQAQTRLAVGLLDRKTVAGGPAAIRDAFERARSRGRKLLVVDAISDDDLRAIGEAAAGLRLVTGGSGIAIGLPENFRRAGLLGVSRLTSRLDAPRGRAVALAGSCSTATRDQIATALAAGTPAFRIDPVAIAEARLSPAEVVEWAMSTEGVPLIYSSAEPQAVRDAQQRLGRDRAGEFVERFLADVAAALRARGFSRFLVAGGETSGAVVGALDVPALLIGPEIDPGVPWTLSLGGERPLALALKSGNFGSAAFFSKAWEMLT